MIGLGTPEQILSFWYSAPVRPLWFRSTAEFDVHLQREYGTLVVEAINSALDAWKTTPHGCLALVLLLDQFPLNIFRNTARLCGRGCGTRRGGTCSDAGI